MRGVLAAMQIHGQYFSFLLPRGGGSLVLSGPAMNCTG